MSDIVVPAILAFVGGLVGGGGLVSAVFIHLLRRREAEQVARIDRVVERKAELYRRCSAFLRGLRSTNLPEAFEQWNSLADEMMLWASNDVYHKFSALARKSFADPSGSKGGSIIDMVFPTLEAMAKDINPSVRLQAKDIIWHATFTSTDAEQLWDAAFRHPKEFNDVTDLIGRNTETMRNIIRHRLGDYDTVKNAILENIHQHLDRGEPEALPTVDSLPNEVTSAVLLALTAHPSDDALSIGQVTGYTGLTIEEAQRGLRALVQAELVNAGRNSNGRPFFWLTKAGKELLETSIGPEAMREHQRKGIKMWLAEHGETEDS